MSDSKPSVSFLTAKKPTYALPPGERRAAILAAVNEVLDAVESGTLASTKDVGVTTSERGDWFRMGQLLLHVQEEVSVLALLLERAGLKWHSVNKSTL